MITIITIIIIHIISIVIIIKTESETRCLLHQMHQVGILLLLQWQRLFHHLSKESWYYLMHLCCQDGILLLLCTGLDTCWRVLLVTWQLLQHSPLLHLEPCVKAHLLQQAPPSFAHSWNTKTPPLEIQTSRGSHAVHNNDALDTYHRAATVALLSRLHKAISTHRRVQQLPEKRCFINANLQRHSCLGVCRLVVPSQVC